MSEVQIYVHSVTLKKLMGEQFNSVESITDEIAEKESQHLSEIDEENDEQEKSEVTEEDSKDAVEKVSDSKTAEIKSNARSLWLKGTQQLLS